jgi:hypothetical protein
MTKKTSKPSIRTTTSNAPATPSSDLVATRRQALKVGAAVVGAGLVTTLGAKKARASGSWGGGGGGGGNGGGNGGGRGGGNGGGRGGGNGGGRGGGGGGGRGR